MKFLVIILVIRNIKALLGIINFLEKSCCSRKPSFYTHSSKLHSFVKQNYFDDVRNAPVLAFVHYKCAVNIINIILGGNLDFTKTKTKK